MKGIHHSAIVTDDVEGSLRFWRDGLGLTEFLDHEFAGDWRALFGADSDVLRSVFLGDPDHPEGGILELVCFASGARDPHPPDAGVRRGFFLLSLNRDVDATLTALASLGFTDGVERISMPAPKGKTVEMAVVRAPDGVLVELIGEPR
jgi:catechol 2,3-dioxygenase-like lactoylglutathione lyase family enzyme